mgnify:CR=1 FL=1|tara:strand:- start:5366 stop:6382 length:1017 start_codon:yes stop_codon:yes gene_type:complete
MKIVIEYESSWRNSFLDGSNNEALPKKGRNFVASMTELRNVENFIPRQVTKDTVIGVLNRLIGDQRKLYQSRASHEGLSHYFADIESTITFEDNPTTVNTETAYIRNIKGSTDQNSFTGMIRVNDPIFQSAYSRSFWGVLGLDTEALCDFILEKRLGEGKIALDPLGVLSRLEELKKLKPLSNEGKVKDASEHLQDHFEKYKPLNSKGQIILLGMYCSALYLQLQHLEKQFDMQSAKSRMGGISGISNNGFTPKDFMDKYTTGAKKLIYGNPYVREEFVKGEGKIKHFLTKASGQLTIQLNIDLDKAIELKTMIDNAGVSAFYLGKKGLAYVSHIDVR